MDATTARDVIRRWAHCRCRYARPPAGPCACLPAVFARAEAETAAQTRRWEKTLLARDEGGRR